MRLERLDIRGYGRLRGSYELAPGLTLVTGPNEAGKSTLHDALIHSLYGFSREERRGRRERSSQKDERMPWTGGQFGLTLRARDREDRTVLAVWDFATDLAVLQDADTGAPLLREKPKRREEYELGTRLVGMTREEFLQVCCLHQEALATVSPSEELRASLQRSLESAPTEEIGVQSADERLRKLLSGLGVHSGHYRELPGGELQRLAVRERALLEELATARSQRAELDSFAASLDEAHERYAELAQRKVELTTHAEELQRASLQAAAARAQASLRTHVHELELRCTHAIASLAAPQPAGASASDLEDRAAGAPASTLEDRAVGAPTSDLKGPAAGAPVGPTTGIPEVDPVVARFRERRDELLAMRAHPDRPSWNAGLLAAALVIAAIAAIGAAIVNPALAGLLLGAAALAWAARPQPLQGTGPDSPLADFDGRSFAELDRARIEEDRRLTSLEAERIAERIAAQRELHAAQAQLRTHEHAHGVLAGESSALDPESPQPDLVGLEAQLRETDTQTTRLHTVIGEREAGLADPADLEVQLAEVHSRRERVELERDAVRIARDALRDAAQDTHRRVAPYLNEALRRELPRITRGRYAEGAVDEDLAISLYAPESGTLVNIEQLSRGTRDQVALVQRLEIARLLDPTAGRAPLLLDDPFAHFDPERLRLGAELIAEVAERRQVILFTEDPEVARQIGESCPSCVSIELPDPVRESADAPERSVAGAPAGA